MDPPAERRRRLRVLIVTSSYPQSPEDPSGIFIERLVRQLPETVQAMVIAPATCESRPATFPGSPLVRVRYAPRAWRKLTGSGGIPAALDAQPLLWSVVPLLLAGMFLRTLSLARNADVIHANWSMMGVIAGIAGWIGRRPVITTLRGEDVNRAARSAVYRLLIGICLGLSARVTTVSLAMQRRIEQLFPSPRRPCLFLPNGVSRPEWRPLPAAGSAPDVVIIAVGSLIPRKDVATLIRAFARVAPGSAATLTIVGDGVERSMLEALAADAGLTGRVRFTGQMAPETVPGMLAEADIFVLASRSEGRSNALLEAMAAGLAVIASDIEGTGELVEDGVSGLLFTAGDDAMLASQLQRLLAEPALRQRLARAARTAVESQLPTWEQCASRYAELYAAVCAERA